MKLLGHKCKWLFDLCNMTSLNWLGEAREIKVFYGRITDVTSNHCEIRGDKDNVNVGDFIFNLRFSPPTFRQRMTYSLGLINHRNVVCHCDGETVCVSRSEGDKTDKTSLLIRMVTNSKETNNITSYVEPPQGSADGILWIDFNFPQDEK